MGVWEKWVDDEEVKRGCIFGENREAHVEIWVFDSWLLRNLKVGEGEELMGLIENMSSSVLCKSRV